MSVADESLRRKLQELERASGPAAAGERPAPLRSWVIGFAILAGLVALNEAAFRVLFGARYVDWYLANGTLIGFATSLVTTAWGDPNRNLDLISAHPLRYLRACAWVEGLAFHALGTPLRRNETAPARRSSLDTLLGLAVMGVVMGLLLLWAVVVVPLQYAVNLVAGAPARLAHSSEWRPVARMRPDGSLEVDEIRKSESVPGDGWDSGLFGKPVAITGLLSAVLLYLARAVVS